MNIFRITLIAFSLVIVVNCGGGGGTAAVTPTPMTMMPPGTDDPMTPPDNTPVALPTALIANPATARGHIDGSTAPSSTLTSTQIQSNFRSRATNNGDSVTTSDAYVVTPTTPSGSDMSGGNINLGGTTFTASLSNIATDIGGRFGLTGVSSEYSSVMEHRGVTLAQYRGAGRESDNDVLEYLSYGGWLTNSAFSVDMLTINDGSNESSLLIGVSYGDATGSRPTGTNSINWQGLVIGMHKTGGVIQGDAMITVENPSSNTIRLIEFANIVNLNDGTEVRDMNWVNVSIGTDGTFSRNTTNTNINGAFFGTDHAEVGGTFNRNGIIGAFGGTKQ